MDETEVDGSRGCDEGIHQLVPSRSSSRPPSSSTGDHAPGHDGIGNPRAPDALARSPTASVHAAYLSTRPLSTARTSCPPRNRRFRRARPRDVRSGKARGHRGLRPPLRGGHHPRSPGGRGLPGRALPGARRRHGNGQSTSRTASTTSAPTRSTGSTRQRSPSSGAASWAIRTASSFESPCPGASRAASSCSTTLAEPRRKPSRPAPSLWNGPSHRSVA
jgi:hypothetical protein